MSYLVFQVSLLVLIFMLVSTLRKRISLVLDKTRINTFVLYILSSFIFILMEEQINCQPAWCLKTVIPPTVPFLLAQTLVVYLVAELLWRYKAMSSAEADNLVVLLLAILYGVFGVLWEYFLGQAGKALFAQGPISASFFVLYVMASYILIVLVPLTVLEVRHVKHRTDDAPTRHKD